MNKLKIQSTAKAGPEKLAFTLVELIVVITILAILGTIAFISLQGYSANSRDSVRISDMGTIKTSLEIYKTDSGNYPLPTNLSEITYSGGIAWSQGYFGEQTIVNLNKLDKVPRDPLTDKEYVYSTTNTRNEYQLAGIFEGDNVSLNIEETIAAGQKTAILRIIGTYNGKILQVSTGSIDYILGVPSIISSTGITLLETIISSKQLAYDGYKNLPYQYNSIGYETVGDPGLILVNIADIVLFSGDKNDLSKIDIIGVEARKALVENLQKAYIDTTIKNVSEIEKILGVTIPDAKTTELLATSIVNYSLGIKIVPGATPNELINTCDTGYGWNGISCIVATECSEGLENITIGTGSNLQSWSCKNLGATIVRDGITNTFISASCITPNGKNCSNKPGWYGDYYQRGRNEPVNTAITTGLYYGIFTGLLGHNNFVFGEFGSGDWWGDEAGDNTPNRWTLTNPQGPCSIGWHIPSNTDWQKACNTLLSPTICGNGMAYNSLISTKLRLPFAGKRNWFDANHRNQSTDGYYWSSTPSNSWSFEMTFNTSVINSSIGFERGNGLSIRCLKN